MALFFSVYTPFLEGNRQSETEHESVWRYPVDAICGIWTNVSFYEEFALFPLFL